MAQFLTKLPALKSGDSVVLNPAMFGMLNGATGGNRIVDPMDLYTRVPLVWRAARLRCNSLADIPRYVYKGDSDTEADWTFEQDRDELYWLMEASMLAKGFTLVIPNANEYGYTADLQWLNPYTVQILRDPHNPGKRLFCQDIEGQRYPQYGYWKEDDVIFLREFSFHTDIYGGDSAFAVAMGDGQLAHYTTRMASIFFENGAMPVTLVTAANGFGTQTEEVQSFFRRQVQGIRNAFRTLALQGGGIEVNTIQSRMKDLAIPDLDTRSMKNIAHAFEMPSIFLDSDQAFASAMNAIKFIFYDSTVSPRAKKFDTQITKKALEPLGLRIVSKPEQLDIYTEHERETMAAMAEFAATLNTIPDMPSLELAAETFHMVVNMDLAQKMFDEREKRKKEAANALAAQAANQTAPMNPVAQPVVEPDAKPPAGAQVKALKAANQTGVMIALPIPTGGALTLAKVAQDALGKDAEITAPDQMHLTLAYMGNTETSGTTREILQTLVRVFASDHVTLNGVIGGKGQFNHADENGRSAVYAAFDSPALPSLFHDLAEMLDAAGIQYDKTHGFIPHITLGYVADSAALAEMDLPDLQMTLDNVVLAWGGEWDAFALTANTKTLDLELDAAKVKERAQFKAWNKRRAAQGELFDPSAFKFLHLTADEQAQEIKAIQEGGEYAGDVSSQLNRLELNRPDTLLREQFANALAKFDAAMGA